MIKRQFWSEKFKKHSAIGDLPVRWAFDVDTARQTETDSLLLARDRWFELTNESAECMQITMKAEWDEEMTWLYEYGVFMAILCIPL